METWETSNPPPRDDGLLGLFSLFYEYFFISSRTYLLSRYLSSC